jgi:hypothetical protein
MINKNTLTFLKAAVNGDAFRVHILLEYPDVTPWISDNKAI